MRNAVGVRVENILPLNIYCGKKKVSSVTQEQLHSVGRSYLAFPKELLLPQQPGLLENEVVSVAQEERVLKFVIKGRISIQAISS